METVLETLNCAILIDRNRLQCYEFLNPNDTFILLVGVVLFMNFVNCFKKNWFDFFQLFQCQPSLSALIKFIVSQ